MPDLLHSHPRDILERYEMQQYPLFDVTRQRPPELRAPAADHRVDVE